MIKISRGTRFSTVFKRTPKSASDIAFSACVFRIRINLLTMSSMHWHYEKSLTLLWNSGTICVYLSQNHVGKIIGFQGFQVLFSFSFFFFPIFKLCLSLFIIELWEFFIYYGGRFYQIHDLQMFSPILWVVFTFLLMSFVAQRF